MNSEMQRHFEEMDEMHFRLGSSRKELESKEITIMSLENEIKDLRHRLKNSKEQHKKESEELKMQHQQELFIARKMLNEKQSREKGAYGR